MAKTDEDYQKVILVIARVLGEAHEPMLVAQIARAAGATELVTKNALHGMMPKFVQKIGKRYATAGLDFPKPTRTSRRMRRPTKK